MRYIVTEYYIPISAAYAAPKYLTTNFIDLYKKTNFKYFRG